jgi:hypothetical protein
MQKEPSAKTKSIFVHGKKSFHSLIRYSGRNRFVEFVERQGDQIGRVFAYGARNTCGSVLKLQKFPTFCDEFFHGKS